MLTPDQIKLREAASSIKSGDYQSVDELEHLYKAFTPERILELLALVERAALDTKRMQFLIHNPRWSVRWRVHTKKQIEQWQMVDDGEPWGQWGEYRAVLDVARRATTTKDTVHGDAE